MDAETHWQQWEALRTPQCEGRKGSNTSISSRTELDHPAAGGAGGLQVLINSLLSSTEGKGTSSPKTSSSQ